MFDPFACANSLRDNLLSYLTSSLPIGNHPSQKKLGDAFYAEWSRELFKGPFVEALPKYKTVSSIADQLRDRVGVDPFPTLMSQASQLTWDQVDAKYLCARDRLWSEYAQEKEAEKHETSAYRLWNQSLYQHQWEAFQTICRRGQSAAITTGTASGKTECYLLPLLNILANEAPAERATPGVRAIILFPMNALVEDQIRRLRKLLFWINLAVARQSSQSATRLNRSLTFGRYTGDTPVTEADRSRTKPTDNIEELGELVTRLSMRRTPPDILVTNFSMLEYALLRSDDQELFKQPGAFKLLVLDEIHTYSGTVGAEVAMLLRRFKSHLSERAPRSLRPPLFVGTSATVGSGSLAQDEMARFASKLFGTFFDKSQVITGTTSLIGEGVPPEVEHDQRHSTEVFFDPANDRLSDFHAIGPYLSVANVDANSMETARMRQFSPKPGSKTQLMLEKRNDIRDVGAPHTILTCLALSETNSQPYYLLHEFPTDIARLRVSANKERHRLQSSPRFEALTQHSGSSIQKRSSTKHDFWFTLAESLLIASSRLLDIDEGANAELGITFRTGGGEPCLDDREVILFDTAPGGAGYAREIANNLKEVFSTAARILTDCACGDSCYRCLRSYRNQWTHSRLDRHLVYEGLAAFIQLNWPSL